jgi:hypothetical protein
METTSAPRFDLKLCEPAADHSHDVDEARYERLRRPCPECNELGLRIVYGHPCCSLLDAAAQGMVLVGGCTHRAMTHRCPNGHEWQALDTMSKAS